MSGMVSARQGDGRRVVRSSCTGVVTLLAFFVAMAASSVAPAQDYPTRPVRIVVGQSAGSSADAIARLIAESLSALWRQPVNVENKGGAAGTIAADLIAKAPADGYALLLGGQGNLVIAATLEPALRYDPSRDFVPIARLARTPFFLVTSAGVPARTIPELVAYARAHPGKLTYISYGDGSVSRVAFDWLETAAGIELLEIPYKGSASATADLLAGRVDMGLYDHSTVEQHVGAGTLHMLAAVGAARAVSAPDVATVAEQGVRGYAIDPWYGLLAPAGTPPDVVTRISGAIDQIRRTAAFRRRLAELTYEPVIDTPTQFAAIVRSDIATYADIIQRAGIKARRNPQSAIQ